MKARIRIDLPPGVEDTPDVRAKIVAKVSAQLGCGPDCDHDLEKSGKPAPKLRNRAPQSAVEQSMRLHEALMSAMIEDIAAALE